MTAWEIRTMPSTIAEAGPGVGRGGALRWLKAIPFLAVHLGCTAALITGVDRSALLLCAAFYLARMFGITAGYHRYFSHRSYKTSRAFQFILAWLGCSAMQKGPLWWAAHHRAHHRHSDAPGDPHSPYTNSLWWSHIGWIFAFGDRPIDRRSVQDLDRFPELRWLDRRHWTPGLALALACYLVGGPTGLVWGFFVSTVLCYHAIFAVNSLAHLIGSRRYDTGDESRNNLVLALITLGEGWHNNHHHYAGSANLGFFWWEIDIGYYLVKLLERAGLVWDVRNPPPAQILTRPSRDPCTPSGHLDRDPVGPSENHDRRVTSASARDC